MSTDGVLTHRGLRSAVHVKVEKCCKGVASNRKVLIVDERSSLFLSRAMKVHELMECNILLIEDIKKVRQPLPNSVALYFITTDVESIDHLIQDWDGSGSPPRKYLEAHVFFLCRVSDITVERICVALGANLKSLRELLLSFSVVDRFFYEVESSGGTLALCCCAVPHNATAAMKDIAPSRFEFSKEALSLTSVLHTLGDKSAVVRYLNRPICRAFAEQLMETLTVVAQLDEELAQRDASPPESTTEVLILDRSLDWTNPLMHDLTYSAFLNDVMPLAGMRTTVESERKDGTRSVKEYLIDDEDAVWTRLRYEHLGDANREIHQELRSLMETQNRGNGRGGDAAVSKMTISELTQAVHRIPEIQQQSARLSVHVDLLSRLNQHFKERKLETPISLEQKIITRHASVDGPKVSEKEIEAELIPFLQNDTYSTAERSRVLLLYAMTLGGDMKRLRELVVKTANMKIDERLLELCATQLTHDAWKLSTEGEKRLKNALKKKGDKNKKGKDGAATMLYDLSRSVPIIRTVAQLLTRGLLPEETFPRVADIAATGRNPTEGLHGGKPAAIAPTSLRKATAATSWANPFRQGKQTTPMRTIEVTASHTMKVQGPRYVLFILGGLTYSEMKHIHDVISEESVEMYAGGTTSLSPDEFLRALHEKATTL